MKLILVGFMVFIHSNSNIGVLAANCHDLNTQFKENINKKITYLREKGKKHITAKEAFDISQRVFSSDYDKIIHESCNDSINTYRSDTFNDINTCKETMKDLVPTFITQMIFETGWFAAELAKKNNFGGLGYDGMIGRRMVGKKMIKNSLYAKIKHDPKYVDNDKKRDVILPINSHELRSPFRT